MSPPPSTSDADRPLRADARRNRDRLLLVADEVFTDRGTGVATEEIARMAGVGVGTLFRHFPTKEALLEAVYVRRLRQLADAAASLADATDPGAALRDFFTRVVDQSASKNAVADALAQSGVDVRTAGAGAGADLRAALGVLLVRAQQAGSVRTDVETTDLLALLVGASRAVEQLPSDPAARQRTLRVVLDGLATG